MLVVLLLATLFVGCSGQDSIESGFEPIDDENEPLIQKAPDEVLEEETLSENDDVEIGELI